MVDRATPILIIGAADPRTAWKVRFVDSTYARAIPAELVIDAATYRHIRVKEDLTDPRSLPTVLASLLTNGAFTADTIWTKGSGWTISGGIATRIADVGTTSINQPVTLVVGGTYRASFEIKTWSAGNFTPGFTGGTTVSGTSRNAVGTYAENLVAVIGNNSFRINANAAGAGTIDNVSLVRVS